MVDWTSPDSLFLQASALDKALFVFIGVYFYELICSIQFDWVLIKTDDSRRSALARCVKWLYFGCRYSTLASCVAVAIIGVPRGSLDCSVIVKLINSGGLFAITSSTLLLFVRVGVVWKWDKRVTAAFTVAWLAIIGLGLRGVVKIGGAPSGDPYSLACSLSNAISNLPNVFSTMLLDIALLVLLFVGLERWNNARVHGLWHLLWNQGLIYLGVAIIIEIPLTVFFFLNYNEIVFLFIDLPYSKSLNHGRQRRPPLTKYPGTQPWFSATRLYRSLTSFSTTKRGNLTYESTYTTTVGPHPPLPQNVHARSGLRFANPRLHSEGYEMDNRRLSARPIDHRVDADGVQMLSEAA
ncbi:unnamed protein product [Peniophora sp. CBMAI 1063]|nr:unnamed protein product [Peniophora sp. CBMAI 1063]